MATPGIVAAFARYKATLTNPQWAVSAEVPGAVVMSLWAHLFKRGMVYEDRLSRWSGNGNALFRKHLELVEREGLPVYLVIATSSDPAAVDRGDDASKIPKTFAVRPELVGKLVRFDGDAFVIEFSRR